MGKKKSAILVPFSANIGSMRSSWSFRTLSPRLWIFFWEVPHRAQGELSKFELLPRELFVQICSQYDLEDLAILSETSTTMSRNVRHLAVISSLFKSEQPTMAVAFAISLAGGTKLHNLEALEKATKLPRCSLCLGTGDYFSLQTCERLCCDCMKSRMPTLPVKLPTNGSEPSTSDSLRSAELLSNKTVGYTLGSAIYYPPGLVWNDFTCPGTLDNFGYLGTLNSNEKLVEEELEILLEHGVGDKRFVDVCDKARSQQRDGLVRLLIEKAITPKIEQQQRNSIFLGAVILGDSQIVAGLLHSGADVNTKCGDSGNALQAAICREHFHLVPKLLKYNINVNASGGPYDTALGAACCKGNEELVQLLLSHGAELEPTFEEPSRASALQHACCKGKESIVRLLIERGAKVNYVSKKYGTALQAASIDGNAEITKLLLDSGSDIDTHAQTHPSAFQRACQRGHREQFELLLARGANARFGGGHHQTPLEAAIWGGDQWIIRKLELHLQALDADDQTKEEETGESGILPKQVVTVSPIALRSQRAPIRGDFFGPHTRHRVVATCRSRIRRGKGNKPAKKTRDMRTL